TVPMHFENSQDELADSQLAKIETCVEDEINNIEEQKTFQSSEVNRDEILLQRATRIEQRLRSLRRKLDFQVERMQAAAHTPKHR
ncbi:MAG: hypothetical protein MHPSP_000730, partial [Paramarteilia canceri]